MADKTRSHQLYELNKDLVERTNNDADAQKYLELYQSFEVPFDMNEVTAEGAGNYETKKALEIAVGHILEEALKH